MLESNTLKQSHTKFGYYGVVKKIVYSRSRCLVWKLCQCQFFNTRPRLLLNGAWIDAPFSCHSGEQFLRNVGSCVCEQSAETAA